MAVNTGTDENPDRVKFYHFDGVKMNEVDLPKTLGINGWSEDEEYEIVFTR